MSRSLALALPLALVFALGCKVRNSDHCLHKEPDQNGNAWCQSEHSNLPFCSPCQGDNNGCVANEPVMCESYMPPTTETSGETGSTGTTTTGTAGTGSGTGTTG